MASHTNVEAGQTEEYFDIVTDDNQLTGLSKPRSEVHKEGLYHRAVHVWLLAESTGELLLQQRALSKDSWPGLWDISSAGHISAGATPLATARRELNEELGLSLPDIAFEHIYTVLQTTVTNGGAFKNNEFDYVYLITLLEPIPVAAFNLQVAEVAAVKWMAWHDYEEVLARGDPAYVPMEGTVLDNNLFNLLHLRYEEVQSEREIRLRRQIQRYSPVTLHAPLAGISQRDREALRYIVQAAEVMDDIFFEQESPANLALREHLRQRTLSPDATELDLLKYRYFCINKGPWCVLDDGRAFLTTADSAPQDEAHALPTQEGAWHSVSFRAAISACKPPGANFYPSDLTKEEFITWCESLPEEARAQANGFFYVIRRIFDTGEPDKSRLQAVAFSEEYGARLQEAASLLSSAARLTDSASLKSFLEARAAAFVSNDYYDADVAWMNLNSKLDITIGPYETYGDMLFGYKASVEAFVGIRDDEASAKVALFGNHLQELEDHLPEPPEFRATVKGTPPLRVVHLLFNSGDVKGPQTVAFNLPNDERITKELGTAMVLLKNVSHAKFDAVLMPIAAAAIAEEQRDLVDFSSFFTHTLCHECCHAIGPHSICLPDGRASTVRMELQELHSALEEAKADIVGLWALQYLLDKGVVGPELAHSMYVTFLAGCFRSVRFGLNEAHGKGQALIFNWILEKGGFAQQPDGLFTVNFTKIREAVEGLSREVLTIQGRGDRAAAQELLQNYGHTRWGLQAVLDSLNSMQIPVDIVPTFTIHEDLKGV